MRDRTARSRRCLRGANLARPRHPISRRHVLQNVIELNLNIFLQRYESFGVVFPVGLRLDFGDDDAVFLRHDPGDDAVLIMAAPRVEQAEFVFAQVDSTVAGDNGDDGICAPEVSGEDWAGCGVEVATHG